MNLQEPSAALRRLVFRVTRLVASLLPGGTISAFGPGYDKIASILVINLDRQPLRWQRLLRELGRFKTATGAALPTIVQRLPAVDARDGRAVAATADVDPMYQIGDQLFVQPDARLAECFGAEHPVRMTRQEVAVARSHIEAWKAIAIGPHQHVLVLEDDVWFRRRAARAIDLGWRAALRRRGAAGEPHLFYLSFKDADGTATRTEACGMVFRPVRGLWFLSGYVLSREGAVALLRAMPVVGPVDLWMNYRFAELGALALTRPAILQRQDGSSDNSYSILPFLARAGTVDAGTPPVRPDESPNGLTVAWSAGTGDRLAMALSMLGLRTRTFSGSEPKLSAVQIAAISEVFDAIVDPPMEQDAIQAVIDRPDTRFVVEIGAEASHVPWAERLPAARTSVVDGANPHWQPICRLLGLAQPAEEYPTGAPAGTDMFYDGRLDSFQSSPADVAVKALPMDDSPWVLPPNAAWRPRHVEKRRDTSLGRSAHTPANRPPKLVNLIETFPGNLAAFTQEGVVESPDSKRLVLSVAAAGDIRPFRSGAFASARAFGQGRFEAQIKAAAGPGLVTGFFLHRDTPRQEIDIEIMGNDPRRMLVNVYFNPGDEGAALGFGYRGSPCRIDLDFDASADFHAYAIEWFPGRISWSVDGVTVHERRGWDPTPVPHLPMRLHANLWVPRSVELAGRVDRSVLPASAEFRRVAYFVDEEA